MLEAAVRLADESGIEAVSMRRLGQELGVEAMSLYNHVARKDEILAGMIELVLAEVEPPEDGGNWKDEIRRTAVSSYQAFVRHRWACGLMMRGPASAPLECSGRRPCCERSGRGASPPT